jgi:vacuolar-type H+-ATPase subunit F/Vma7
MHKIKIIGPKYMVSPLAILGIEACPAENRSEAQAALEAASGRKADPALIFITERLAHELQEEIKMINLRPEMNVVLIPDNQGSIGLANSQIHDLVRNSIGAEVIIRK